MKKKLSECPVCGSDLKVSEYTCGSCRTKIKGDFICESGMGEMDKEITDFIKVFIMAEGNIKQVEKLMNCSYPKVKNLLRKAKSALNIEEEEEDNSADVIELLAKGEISAEDALNKLTKGGRS
jgi:hypothetical protein